MNYNIIQHEIRNNAGLSMLDYCILEMIYNLSTNGKERYSTWCNAAKPRFKHLASLRTIINRFNALEADGWIEFKDEKRFLKRTTKKYYNEVYAYIGGVKKLHGENVAQVKELHPRGEKVAHLGVKKLHPRGENVAPNKDIDNNSYNNIDKESKKETHEKAKRTFPDNKPKKTYNPKDKRENKQLPFSIVTAKATLDALFPTIEDIEELYNSVYSEKASAEIFEKCKSTFIEIGIANYYTGIRQIELLQKKFLEWIKKEVKFQRNKTNNKPAQNDDGTPVYMMGLN